MVTEDTAQRGFERRGRMVYIVRVTVAIWMLEDVSKSGSWYHNQTDLDEHPNEACRAGEAYPEMSEGMTMRHRTIYWTSFRFASQVCTSNPRQPIRSEAYIRGFSPGGTNVWWVYSVRLFEVGFLRPATTVFPGDDLSLKNMQYRTEI